MPMALSRLVSWWGRHHLLLAAAIVLLVVLAVGAFGVAAVLYPMVPRDLVVATGSEGGGYTEIGERYRQIAARQGVRLTVLGTSGSLENLAMLKSAGSGVGVAFAQNGLTDPQQSPQLVSLGTVINLPLWIFYRGPQASHDRLAHLRGMRVSIGPTGSGSQHLALQLLASNAIDDGNTKLLALSPGEAADRLVAGDIDAAITLATPDAPAVRRLLGAPDVRLMSLSRADGYVALYPFLSKVVLPAGFADMAHDNPAADVTMIAVKVSLIVRRDLPSALQYLLLEAATQVHSRPGVFQKAGEFPAAEGTDLPLSADAQQFYKTGTPLLQRYLPLWLAVLAERLAITVLPIVAVGYPALRALPAVYDWSVRRRIAMLYGELKLLELSLEDRSRDTRAAHAELVGLEHRVAHLRVPSSFAALLYTLRQDISFVRERLEQTS